MLSCNIYSVQKLIENWWYLDMPPTPGTLVHCVCHISVKGMQRMLGLTLCLRTASIHRLQWIDSPIVMPECGQVPWYCIVFSAQSSHGAPRSSFQLMRRRPDNDGGDKSVEGCVGSGSICPFSTGAGRGLGCGEWPSQRARAWSVYATPLPISEFILHNAYMQTHVNTSVQLQQSTKHRLMYHSTRNRSRQFRDDRIFIMPPPP